MTIKKVVVAFWVFFLPSTMHTCFIINKINMQNDLHSKLGQADLVFVCDQSSSVGLYMHDYKSLDIMVPPWLTHGHTDRQHMTSCTISSTS